MSAWWLSPITGLDGSRDFDCAAYGGMSPEECVEYQRPWLNWFQDDLTYALPTVAFFMCTIGVFIISYIASQLRGYSRRQGNPLWRRMLAIQRYLSYRGFHIKRVQWNSPAIAVLLLASIGTIYFCCMAFIPRPYYWPDINMDSSPPLGTRSGWLAIACMPFIFATASKANWITLVTGISHEKLNVFHRYISFAFFGLAMVHAVAFIVYHIHWDDMAEQLGANGEPFEYWTGIIALVFQAWLTFGSLSSIRKLGYEFFKFAHYFSVIIFMLMFFWHCNGALTSWDYFIATAAVYVPSLVYPWLRTFFEYGRSQQAQVSVEEHGVISISIPAEFDWVPGQHCFLRFNGLGWQALSSHPFSICSLPSVTPGKSSSMVFHARRRGGLTARLYSFALAQPKSTGVSVDGPYGGIDLRQFHASDRVLVIAGGSAAGWTLPFIAQFARLRASGAMKDDAGVLDRSMRVIVATRDDKTRRWFLQAVQQVLSETASSMGSLPGLSIWVHLTSEDRAVANTVTDHLSLSSDETKAPFSSEERETKSLSEAGELTELQSHPENLQHYGRPDLPAIVREEASKAADATQTIGVYVCGPPLMQDDVRNAVARENSHILRGSTLGGAYLYSEYYSWA